MLHFVVNTAGKNRNKNPIIKIQKWGKKYVSNIHGGWTFIVD